MYPQYATVIFLLIAMGVLQGQSSHEMDITRWKATASRIEIIRDHWGIPHIYAPTDADAIFGMMYAQCEDDFPRVERNYLDATGQMALALGPDYIWQDLRTRLWMDSTTAIQHYNEAPNWLKNWCNAFADGINYYLHTHPETKPLWIQQFRPWMPFMFTEGSIGGDITRVPLQALQAFYDEEDRIGMADLTPDYLDEPSGSNGFAISKKITTEGRALLLINPHTSFYFRSEQHIVSEEGLNVYGAATWGQFFIYQGFNEHCGWMHTSTYADALDTYEETIVEQQGRLFYQHGKDVRPLTTKIVTIAYIENGQIKERTFTTYHTHHGPVIGKEGNKWLTFSMMNRPTDALLQDVGRMKANGYKRFKKVS
ncbi:MAG: penicillin acylase family protein [Saprospiraceae bacterium]